MLQKIKDHTQGIFTWILILGIAASFLVFGFGSDLFSLFSRGRSKEIAAYVGKTPVSWRLVDSYTESVFKDILSSNPNLTPEEKNQLRVKARKVLADRIALLNFTQQYGLSVNPSQVLQQMQQIPQFQDNGQFSLEKFKRILSGSGLRIEDIQHDIQQNLLLTQLQHAVMQTNFLSPNILENSLAVLLQNRDFHYVTVPHDAFKATVKLSDTDLENYYKENKNSFKIPEQVQVDYVILSKKDNTEESLFADQLEILANLAFEYPDSLKQISEKLNLKIQTSDWLEPGSDDPLTQTAFSEQVIKNLENSEPVALNNTDYAVLYLKNHKPEQNKDFLASKSEIVKILTKNQLREQNRKFVEEFNSQLKAGAQPKKLLAEKYPNLHFIEKLAVTLRDDKIRPEILQAAFTLQSGYKIADLNDEDGSVAFVFLDKVNLNKTSDLPETEKNNYIKQLTGYSNNQEFSAVASQILKQAKIYYYD